MRFTHAIKYPFTLDFTIHCPRDSGTIYPMRLIFDRIPNYGPVARPCEGCEHAREIMICWQCRGTVSEMFYRNPELSICNGIVPEIKR